MELDVNRKYLVPVITDEEGRATSYHLYHRPDLGKVLWLFTSKDKADTFMGGLLSKAPNKPYMDVLQGEFDRPEPRRSEDLNFGYRYSINTLPELLPDLKSNDIDAVVFDPILEGGRPQVVWSKPWPESL